MRSFCSRNQRQPRYNNIDSFGVLMRSGASINYSERRHDMIIYSAQIFGGIEISLLASVDRRPEAETERVCNGQK